MSVIKRKALTIQQRVDILKDLETASVKQVAAAYKINIKTVHRIKKEAATITRMAENKNQTKIKRIRKPGFPELERRLYSWFVERRTLGDKLSDALLLEKARELQDGTESHSSCKMSVGWLARFKKRNNIRLVHLPGYKASADEDAARLFISELKKEIEEDEIDLECVYNMDLTGLLWKAIPSKALVRNEEGDVIDTKEEKEIVTVALCANATGTHKLMPFLIHRYKKPKALRNGTNELPVIYASQKHAWMDQKLFLEWFSHFKKSVQLFQLQQGICNKVILLVRDFEAHKLPTIHIHDSNIEIKYFPPNTTSLIHPMDQVIDKTKKCFRHKLMQHVATYASGKTEFYKKYSITDCIPILANAWADVTSNNIKNSWHELFPHTRIHGEVKREIVGEEEEDEETSILQEMQKIMSQITSRNITTKGITDFLTACKGKERRHLEEGQVRKERYLTDGEISEEYENEDRNEDQSKNWNKERYKNKDECTNENRIQGRRVEGADVRLQKSGIQLSIEERQDLEEFFTHIERYNDRATPAMRILVQSIKLLYLGENLHNRNEI